MLGRVWAERPQWPRGPVGDAPGTPALEEVSPGDIDEWRALVAQAAEPNPFFEPEYVLPAAKFIGGRGVALLVVRASDGWSACLPIHRPRTWHRVPARGLATWQHRYCFCGTPLVRADSIESAVGEMTRELMRERTAGVRRFRLVTRRGAGARSPAGLHRGGGRGGVRVGVYERAALRRRATAHGT